MSESAAKEIGHFVITEHADYLLIEAIGTFTIESMQVSTEQAAQVIRQPGREWNIITDFTDAFIGERGANDVLSKYSKGNRGFVRKSAVLGLGGIKRFFFDLVVRLSGRRDLRPFKSFEKAHAWLLEPLPDEKTEPS